MPVILSGGRRPESKDLGDGWPPVPKMLRLRAARYDQDDKTRTLDKSTNRPPLSGRFAFSSPHRSSLRWIPARFPLVSRWTRVGSARSICKVRARSRRFADGRITVARQGRVAILRCGKSSADERDAARELGNPRRPGRKSRNPSGRKRLPARANMVKACAHSRRIKFSLWPTRAFARIGKLILLRVNCLHQPRSR